ncbi:MAG: AAA family ATPase [Propionibacteriaceae bacterium]|jgi:predicted AAA+ superfamily ATPase|nr:AAA family ATPase [Propionibacteriaceae bacterium]
MESGIVHRLVGDAMLARRDTPVLILEGPRAVGKTTLARRQLPQDSYSYTTLADRSALAFAREDPQGWLSRLKRPAIIDEAQLLPELPLLLKELVDGLPLANHFVLTGSASIGRTGLGGADPLARRATLFTMHPLTLWELNGHKGSLADMLFDVEPAVEKLPHVDDVDLLETMAFGGFPAYVLQKREMSRERLSERVFSDTLATLSVSALPDMAVNPPIALGVLESVLRMPGGILNASRFGRLLGVDKRTYDRYVGVFGKLFLVHWLANLATAPANQSHTRAKIHAIDTSLSVDALTRAGADVLGQRELFGQLLETHVVNQVVASCSWATRGGARGYWRKAGEPVHEVDLVLRRGDGLRVGIEVKAAATVNPADLKGLRALRSASGLSRGFVFYTGDEIRELDEQMWCLPMAALEGPAWASGPS